MDDLHTQVANAIRSVKSQMRWRPGSAARHLLKRKLRGHLPVEATLDDYERIIQTVVEDPQARVYIYRHNDTAYVAVVAVVQSRHWLVIFTLDGRMESAYVVERPERYLSKPVFEMLGLLNEVLV
jgi:hypothetical protein